MAVRPRLATAGRTRRSIAMKRISALSVTMCLVAACSTKPEAPATAAAAPPPPAAQPYANLAQMMRAIPFPASNIIFDTQSEDPGNAKKPGDAQTHSATAAFSGAYGGWPAAEPNALGRTDHVTTARLPRLSCQE